MDNFKESSELSVKEVIIFMCLWLTPALLVLLGVAAGIIWNIVWIR